MSGKPTVAVVVPVFNEQQILPALISRLSVTHADEVVIVDGGSSDGSQALLNASGLQWAASASGRAKQMNTGAALCESEILLFLHADTIIDASHLQAIREAMQDERSVGGRFDVALSGSHIAFRMIAWFMNGRSRLSRISTGDQCIFVRRAVFETLGGFPQLPLMEDIAFSKLLIRAGHIACLRKKVITSSRRWEHNGIFKTVVLMWKLRLLYWLGRPADELATMYRKTGS